MTGPTGVRVLMLAPPQDDAALALGENLDRLGWTTTIARDQGSAQRMLETTTVDAAIVVLEDATPPIVSIPRLRTAAGHRTLPVIALTWPAKPTSETNAASGADFILPRDAHPRQVAARLESLFRAAVSAEEAQVRSETFAARGARLAEPQTDTRRLQVLTIGEPAPKFLALRHALAVGGAEVTAAFTAYTAFDYMHDRGFDAVALWSGEAHAEALSIAGGMRRNTRLFPVPTVLYGRAGVEIGLDDAYARGMSDVALADVSPAEIAHRILALAAERRRHLTIRSTLESIRGTGLLDAPTGLFTPGLFATHLAGLARSAQARRRPLSVAMLRLGAHPRLLRARKEGWLDRATPQIGSMIGRLVRVEDTAARLGDELFAFALPATRLAGARTTAERISAVIACTAFMAGDGQAPFTVDFDVGVAEVDAGSTPSNALERAARQAMGRSAA